MVLLHIHIRIGSIGASTVRRTPPGYMTGFLDVEKFFSRCISGPNITRVV